MRLLRFAVLVAVVPAAGLGAPARGGADTPPCPGAAATSGPQICLTTADTPGRASVATPLRPDGTRASQPYIQYVTTVTNQDTRTVTHLNVKDVLPAGTALQSVSPSTCTTASGGVSCDLGSL